ncbi:di-heme oxidoreductase family protein [Rubrivivax gelatinosus]|uniref:CxxC motif-containing protein (DUF1111 family) n=1 Tax=Rubrivivax gelatinosus TaxID=28068 RepID=A0A4R2M307_RUBGE|nr:di-heme oxidoredictase family protein [Rubrivivax gelatinosus]MBK1690494.1 hypothetical protein [Rubrivivax gelatinosus]TCP01509.1 CxxC motif-containing protein (DUF1111 family) [Rubrivivax gelatinosus]
MSSSPGAGHAPRWRRFTGALLAASLGALGWSVWSTQYAWRAGWGDEPMAQHAAADPRALSGGDLTSFHAGFEPFGQAADNLPWRWAERFEEGDGLFDKRFVPGDGLSASQVKDGPGQRRTGLGPLYNADACSACHLRDGRPPRPHEGGALQGLFVRASVPDGRGGWQAAPGYASQLRDKAVAGVRPEARPRVEWQEEPGRYPDGQPYRLRRPRIVLEELAYGALPPDALLEIRSAPPVHGGGLLEALDARDILAREDPEGRRDPDGVSGRAQWVADPETGERVLGRFSLKANQPSLRAQAAGAAFDDMGLTSPVHPRPSCLAHQHDCLAAPHGGTEAEPELSEAQLQALTDYLRWLAVPARRGLDDALALQGERLFAQIRCSACHVPEMVTGGGHPIARLRGQRIRPYTDLLLHDMGPGLAGRPDGVAGAAEWRTAPLWGIGLSARSQGYQRFLHDQRARSLEEAVLWHGGEAEPARRRFMNLTHDERQALIRFLETL